MMVKPALNTDFNLLPLNASASERALDVLATQVLGMDLTAVDLNPASCPTHLLPWLAVQWRVSLTGLNELEQRLLLANALEVHKYKGTVYAVKKALSAVFKQVDVIEQASHLNVFEFEAAVTLSNDTKAVFDKQKFNTATALVNKAKNARSRFKGFEVSLPMAKCHVVKADACSVNLTLNAGLNMNANAPIYLQGVCLWTI